MHPKNDKLQAIMKSLDLSPNRIERLSCGRFKARAVRNWVEGQTPRATTAHQFVLWLRRLDAGLAAPGRPSLSPMLSIAHIWGETNNSINNIATESNPVKGAA